MRLGIMQPYFFPYLGYFDLIHTTDRWIVFDTAQYIRHGWVNRNRILHPSESWKYIVVPLTKHARETSIADIEVHANNEWRRRIVAQLDHYRRRAPFFRETIDVVHTCLATTERRLARINAEALRRVCEYLGWEPTIEYFSEMSLDIGPIHGPGDWAPRIAAALGATQYVNPSGGAGLFSREQFQSLGIELELRPFSPLIYECPGYQYEPGLSIIDVMMWNAPSTIKGFLESLSKIDEPAPLAKP